MGEHSISVGNHIMKRSGFQVISVLPTSQVFISGYVNTETILHFFYKITNERGMKTVFTYTQCKMVLWPIRVRVLFELFYKSFYLPVSWWISMQEFFSIFQDSLGKQCWVVLGRVLSTVRSDPAQLVTALRIVERETRYHLLCIIFYFLDQLIYSQQSSLNIFTYKV